MSTGVRCRADPRCEVPAPAETGICHCHAAQAKRAGVTIHRLSAAEQMKRAWTREKEREAQ